MRILKEEDQNLQECEKILAQFFEVCYTSFIKCFDCKSFLRGRETIWTTNK